MKKFKLVIVSALSISLFATFMSPSYSDVFAENLEPAEEVVAVEGNKPDAETGEVELVESEVAEGEDANVGETKIKKVSVRIKAVDEKGEVLALFYATLKNVTTGEEKDASDFKELEAGKYQLLNVRAQNYETVESFDFEITNEQVEEGKEVEVKVPMKFQKETQDTAKVVFRFTNEKDEALEYDDIKNLKIEIYDEDSNKYTTEDILDKEKVYSYKVSSDDYETKTGRFNLYTYAGETYDLVDVQLTLKDKNTTVPTSVLKSFPVFFVGEKRDFSFSSTDKGSGFQEVTLRNIPESISAYTIYSKEIVANGSSVYPLSFSMTLEGTATETIKGDHITGLFMKDGVGNSITYYYLIRVLDRQDLKKYIENEAGYVLVSNKYKLADKELKEAYDKVIEEALTVVNNKDANTATQEAIDEVLKKLRESQEALNGKNDSELYDPKGVNVEVYKGEKIDINSTLDNKEDLPEKIVLEWKNGEEPDNTKEGIKEYTVVVTYPDKSQDEYTITVTVKLRDNEKYHVYFRDLEVHENEKIEAKDFVANLDELASGTEITFLDSDTVLDMAVGEHSVNIVVTFPDGSANIQEVRYNVLKIDNSSSGEMTSAESSETTSAESSETTSAESSEISAETAGSSSSRMENKNEANKSVAKTGESNSVIALALLLSAATVVLIGLRKKQNN